MTTFTPTPTAVSEGLSWPFKPRGQRPLDWVSNSKIKIPNGKSRRHVMNVERKRKESA